MRALLQPKPYKQFSRKLGKWVTVVPEPKIFWTGIDRNQIKIKTNSKNI